MGVVWKINGIYNADAGKVYDEIQGIGDRVTPEKLVHFARINTTSELHKCFEWSDKKAANLYRIQQAGNILRMLVVDNAEDCKEGEQPVTFRAMVLTKEVVHEYAPIQAVVRNDDQYAKLLDAAKKELAAFSTKYRKVAELREIIDEIDRWL